MPNEREGEDTMPNEEELSSTLQDLGDPPEMTGCVENQLRDARAILNDLAADLAGKIEEAGLLPDGSGFAVMTMPLPKDHWLYADHDNIPPMPFRRGTDEPSRQKWVKMIEAAGRYAVRCATMNGQEMDFDPDALIQSLIVGMVGYYTPTGRSSDPAFYPPLQEEG